MPNSTRFKPYKTPLVHRSVPHSKYITTTRRPTPSEPGKPYRPSMLVSAPRRMTKAKFVELSENAKAQEEAVIKDKLTRAQLQELDTLRNQIAGGSNVHEDLLYNTTENNPIDSENNNSDLDDEWIDEETLVMDGLGLRTANNAEWENRLKTKEDSWEEQLPALCDAYLEFINKSAPKALSGGLQAEYSKEVKIRFIKLWKEESKPFSFESAGGNTTGLASIALVRHGFIPPSPIQPTSAISMKVLYVLERIQQRCPSASIQGMAKAFCDLRNVPYKSYFHTQLSNALDVYYMIKREAQRRLDKFRGLDSPELKLRECCPSCTKKLPNEPELHYSMEVTADGGNSYKRCALAGTIDKRAYKSDYYISRSEVDRFEDEVAGSKKGKQKSKESEVSECEQQWKNASADKRPDKKEKSYFEETGIFVSLCRHSCVLTVCDMVRSGEKAKYVLATINQLISTFGAGILMGYDIGCTMTGTVSRSPLLGAKAAKLQFDMCVGSFHGAAHNRTCQLRNHPQNHLGAGLSDLENAETFFSYANRIASSTRLASCFRRHQRIDMLIKTWNDDMYKALGSLLRRKYIAALKTIKSTEEFLGHLSNSAQKIEGYFKDEVRYMASFKKELPSDTFKIEYICLLEQLEVKEDEFNTCISEKPSTADQSDLHCLALFKSRNNARRRVLLEQLIALQQAVQKVEEDHNLVRWTRESTKWREAQMLRDHGYFQSCVDTLEHLVVQQLLELSRAGLANTGYKLRQQIARSVATRSGAVKTALTKYNAAAAQLKPPAPKITWEQITKTTILADFDLLCDSRHKVLDQAWAQPKNRRCVEQLHRLQRAHKEIKRLNIELLRLHTSIIDKEQQLLAELDNLCAGGSPLFPLLQRYTICWVAVNTMLLKELERTRELKGYTGSKVIGTCPDSTLDDEIDLEIEESPQSDDHEAHDASASLDQDGGLEVDDATVDWFERWQSVLERAKAS